MPASVNGSNGGQKKNGKPRGRPFKIGNPGGPGNPWAKATHSLKSALIAISETASDEDDCRTKADELAKTLWDMALSEDGGQDRRFAISELYNRMCGKPKETVEVQGGGAAEAIRAGFIDLLKRPEVADALEREGLN